MRHTLIAVFDNRADADRAQDELLASGFSRSEVSISKGDPTGMSDSLTGRATTSPATEEVGETMGSSIKRFFHDIFGSDTSPHVQKYSDAVSRGHHVLTVSAADEPEVERAADIVERHGPVDIDEKASEWAGGAAVAHPESMRASGVGGMQQSAGLSQQSGDRNLFAQQSLNDEVPQGQTYQEPMGSSGSLQGGSLQGTAAGSQQFAPSPSGTGMGAGAGSLQRERIDTTAERDTGTQAAIPVVQEELKVGKREVRRGGVRIFSHVVETPVDETIGLREEHVNVERRPMNEPVRPGDSTAFKDQTIEMHERAEEAVVEKSARVVEEVVVGKQVSERQEHIHDTVRHTEVNVEQLAGDTTSPASMSDEDYWRQHWTSNYGKAGGTFDEYAPAYRYGSDMARSDMYRGRPWNDVETNLRTDWEGRYGGGAASTWDKMKGAVRHAWDRMTSMGSGTSTDDDYYRTHWNSNYAAAGSVYDDYAPAYRYGSEMAGSDKYRGRKWDEVESDLRSDWDTRYGGGGASTWERFKAAVRHGWDRMTS